MVTRPSPLDPVKVPDGTVAEPVGSDRPDLTARQIGLTPGSPSLVTSTLADEAPLKRPRGLLRSTTQLPGQGCGTPIADGVSMPEVPTVPSDPRGPYRRRLTDKILVAFHQACDQGDLEVAERLLAVVEMMRRRAPTDRRMDHRRNTEWLVAAHERLWTLRHPEAATV